MATIFPRDRFASLLGGAADAGSFSARRTARPDDLRLEVTDIGPITLPVSVRQAKELCLIGRPARFGKGEQTLLDAKVRDTWQVPKSRVKIDKRRWNVTLRHVLERLRADLGLPEGCELTAEFHAMLVYAPGQFFAPHQDSEKADGMIGTLVVTLPSAATGGVLVVEHAGQTATYRSSKESLSFVAFYADCRHHVRPVTSGYRVVLTYNLLLKGDSVAAAAGRTDPRLTAELAECLNQHFGDSDEPARLVYLLDHEYTQRGLGWARLKGDDASRAALVRAAALAADCEVALALAEVHEQWIAEDAEPNGRYWDDDDGDETEEDGDYELQELIESTTSLDCWLDEGDEATPTSLIVYDDEVCATTPTADLSPHASSYEGYLGNYGNTLERWYRRAAIVVWPRRWAFAIRAQASPMWALDRLADLVRAGDVAEARDAAAMLAPFWSVVAKANAEQMLGKALTVAHDLDEPGTAAMLLTPFQIEMLGRSHAAALARVAVRYGDSWTRELVDVWFGRDRPAYLASQQQRAVWLESLPAVCDALCETPEDGVSVGRLLSAAAWTPLRESVDRTLRYPAPSHRHAALSELGPAVAGLLLSTANLAAADLRDEMVAFLSVDNDDLLVCAMSALRAAHTASRATRAAAGLDVVSRHCAARLATRLARPIRSADDWSIELPAGCHCELCQTLDAFLTDKARRSFEWPLAEQRRRHVHARIDQHELPVRHQTRRSGRPYTLVLTKTEALFAREREARQRDQTDLAWLDRTSDAR
ncbi:2OG-Fe(II) oxygenase [Dactylosporangium roseum]|uniref:2OG-Fe(II) oxygenase n=1 Tax=Dactylosporangium roseum TaxID=47989 RepID=A0ABY5Z662_9ACTN|nr:2OG-Fe(II) oxygenase [Dactylosporangium roseum]UWZ36213.1 2OG-Fe(II) oxygenase [Dactylosporangium roseum]